MNGVARQLLRTDYKELDAVKRKLLLPRHISDPVYLTVHNHRTHELVSPGNNSATMEICNSEKKERSRDIP